jgi:hypothetical protein
MKSIPPFSKEMYTGDCVYNDEDGERSGFTARVTMTKAKEREPRKGLADFQEQPPGLEGNESYPKFRKKADDGLPPFPAPFSKKTISGGPAQPGTPARDRDYDDD